MRLSLKLRQFCIAQFAIVTVIIALGAFAYTISRLTGQFSAFGFLRLLDVGSEQSIPTFVSVINLLLSSILLFVIFYYEKTNTRNTSGYWGFLSILFLFLSVDESAGVHENFGSVYRYLVNNDFVSPTLDTHHWLPFGVLFVLGISIVLVRFMCKLPTDTRLYFLIAGSVYVAGALGFEYLGAIMLETGVVESKNDTAYLIRRLFEEGCEMYGIAFFNCALYREIFLRKISVVVTSTQ